MSSRAMQGQKGKYVMMNGGGRKPLIPKHLIFWLIFFMPLVPMEKQSEQAAAHTSVFMEQYSLGV